MSDEELDLMKRAIILLCSHIRPDGQMAYINWEQSVELRGIAEKLQIIETPKNLPAKSKRFIPPTIEEVTDYCIERNNGIDPQAFIDYYEARGWQLNKQKMKDWKAAVRTWERNDFSSTKPTQQNKSFNPFDDENL